MEKLKATLQADSPLDNKLELLRSFNEENEKGLNFVVGDGQSVKRDVVESLLDLLNTTKSTQG